jgi:sodium/bile acid cotransporter 7
MKIDKFILAIIVVIIIAYFFPEWGSADSPVPLDLISSIGVLLIFFFYGLKLSPEKIKEGLKNWKLHCTVQAVTFLVFPLLVLIFYPLVKSEEQNEIWLGFFFLAALPSTVSSSVVMISIAKGNIPGAIFNASISGLIGIAITPLWMGLFLQRSEAEFNLGIIYIKLLTEILVPVLMGLALHRYFGKYVQTYGKYLSLFDKSVILLIIFKSFCDSFAKNIFSAVSYMDLLIISAAVIGLFYTVYFLTGFIAKQLRFNREDTITVQFCGTIKSLVHGTVFSKILFPASMPIGVILLPLMLFHVIQLFIISMIAARLGKMK